jgi:hypothetical protein
MISGHLRNWSDPTHCRLKLQSSHAKRAPPGHLAHRGPPREVLPYVQPSRDSEATAAVVEEGSATA